MLVKLYSRLISSLGVEIFLFLSGIGLYFSMQKNQNIKIFYRKRIQRTLIPAAIVMTCYWVVLDILIKKSDVLQFISDLTFITFWTSGIRTFWYVLLVFMSYAIWPLVYRYFKCPMADKYKLFSIPFATIALPYVIKELSPDVYANTEILLNRFFIFLLGGLAGKKVYYQDKITRMDFALLNTGFLLKILSEVNSTLWISTNGYRVVSCFWGITVLFYGALLLKLIKSVKFKKIVSTFGKSSFELYLTHVAIRGIMKNCGIQTYHLLNYLICIAMSIIFTCVLNSIRRRLINNENCAI